MQMLRSRAILLRSSGVGKPGLTAVCQRAGWHAALVGGDLGGERLPLLMQQRPTCQVAAAVRYGGRYSGQATPASAKPTGIARCTVRLRCR
jgi:hypothetical protein